LNAVLLDRAVGDQAKMPEIHRHLAEDEGLKNLSAEKEAEILLALSEHQENEEIGARYNNKGASIDYTGTLKRVCTEASHLSYYLVDETAVLT